MRQLIKLRSPESSKDKGFITIEILVSILIASIFLALSLQGLVYAMAIKVQAQEKQRASQLITKDIETANELANSNNLAGACNPLDYAGGYANGLWTQLNTGTTKTLSLLSDGGGRQLALERIPLGAGSSTDPHRTLKVKYQVWWGWNGTNFLDKDGTNKITSDQPIAETYVEVIPDVALQCP